MLTRCKETSFRSRLRSQSRNVRDLIHHKYYWGIGEQRDDCVSSMSRGCWQSSVIPYNCTSAFCDPITSRVHGRRATASGGACNNGREVEILAGRAGRLVRLLNQWKNEWRSESPPASGSVAPAGRSALCAARQQLMSRWWMTWLCS